MVTLQSEGVLPRKAAATALKKFAVQSKENGKKGESVVGSINQIR